MNKIKNSETPLGLGLTLLLNRKAFLKFSSLSVPEQQDFIENAHFAETNHDMENYVLTLINERGK